MRKLFLLVLAFAFAPLAALAGTTITAPATGTTWQIGSADNTVSWTYTGTRSSILQVQLESIDDPDVFVTVPTAKTINASSKTTVVTIPSTYVDANDETVDLPEGTYRLIVGVIVGNEWRDNNDLATAPLIELTTDDGGVIDPGSTITGWKEPGSVPPLCKSDNVACFSPINVSGTAQTKVGGLTIGGDFKLTKGAHDKYVLTSDASGLATWKPAGNGSSTGDTTTIINQTGGDSLWATTSSNAIFNKNTGNVGIGTNAAESKLHVKGTSVNGEAVMVDAPNGAAFFIMRDRNNTTNQGAIYSNLGSLYMETSESGNILLRDHKVSGTTVTKRDRMIIAPNRTTIANVVGGGDTYLTLRAAGRDTDIFNFDGNLYLQSKTGKIVLRDKTNNDVLMANGYGVGIGGIDSKPNLKLTVNGNVGADKYCDKNGEHCVTTLGGNPPPTNQVQVVESSQTSPSTDRMIAVKASCPSGSKVMACSGTLSDCEESNCGYHGSRPTDNNTSCTSFFDASGDITDGKNKDRSSAVGVALGATSYAYCLKQ